MNQNEQYTAMAAIIGRPQVKSTVHRVGDLVAIETVTIVVHKAEFLAGPRQDFKSPFANKRPVKKRDDGEELIDSFFDAIGNGG